MKGKRKGKDQGSSKDSSTQQVDSSMQQVDLVIKPHEYPTYSAIIKQDENCEDSIENLNNLEVELDRLLKSVKDRVDNLEEMKSLLSVQDQKSKPPPRTGGKKGKTETTPAKKIKVNTSKARTGTSSCRPNSKNQNRPQDQTAAETAQSLASSQKNDVPSRFWESLKPFSADITEDNRKFLEEWAKPIDDDDEYYKIPSLGKHYTYDWSHKDIKEEQKEGSKANDKRKCSGPSSSSSLGSAETDVILKKARRDHSDDPCPFGPLTQRLVSCLIEKNVMTPPDDIEDIDIQDSEDSQPSNGEIIKSLNIGDPMDLENRIRKGLEVAGILKAEGENEEDKVQDEVLTELKRVQANLKAVSKHNLALKQKLLNLAIKEMDRQKLREKLDITDAEILTIRANMTIAKQNENSSKGKEYAEMEKRAIQLLRDRQKILNEIEAVE